MQLKLGQQKQRLAVESEGSMRSKLASFQKFTDEMVDKYGSGTLQPDQQVLDAVGQVLDFIGAMYGHLLDAHNDDLAAAGKCTAVPGSLSSGVQQCIDSYMNDTHQGLIQTAKDNSDTSQDEHVNCRNNAVADCQALCAPNGPCQKYDNYRTLNPNAHLPTCAKDGAFDDENIQAAEGSEDLETMEECLLPTKNWLDALYGLYQNCTRVEDTCIAKVEECDEAQKTFEARRCTYALQSDISCNNVRTCCEGHCQDCYDECPKIEMRAGARAADNETGERLVCLLHTLFGQPNDWEPPTAEEKPGKLEECKNKVINVDGWKIACTSGEACMEECSMDQTLCPDGGVKKPCDNDFIFELTNDGVFLTTLPLDENAVCPETARRGSRKVIKQCEDVHEECTR